MPIMTYLADKFGSSYDGSFIKHYGVFFTRFTDLTGADGGFSFGQFWFCLYLFVISAISVGVLTLIKHKADGEPKALPLWAIVLLGYFIFSSDKTIDKLEKYRYPLLAVGLLSTILNVYLFLWCDKDLSLLNTATKYISEWFMMLSLIGVAKRHMNFSGKLSGYMSHRSFLFYIWHFIWVVLFQYLLFKWAGNNTPLLFFGTVTASYIVTFLCCEICIRIPLLCLLTGTKHISKKQR